MVSKKRLFGFWEESFKASKSFSGSTQSIKDYWNPDSKTEYLDKIILYLQNGYMLSSYRGMDEDLIDPSHKIISGGYSALTDGTWIWASHTTTYIERHGIQIDKNFLEHITSNQMNIPQVTESELLYYSDIWMDIIKGII